MSFRVSNFSNLWATRSIWFPKCSKFNVHFKNAIKHWQKAFRFSYISVWTGGGKFFLFLEEYASIVLNMLTTGPRISNLKKKWVFATYFDSKSWKSRITVLFCRLQQFYGLVNTFTAEGFGETRLFMQLGKHVFQGQ